MAFFSNDDPDFENKFRKMFGPDHVDQQLRQAIRICWMMLPADKRSIDEVEQQIRRLMDRAFRDMREDFDSFGLNQPSK